MQSVETRLCQCVGHYLNELGQDEKELLEEHFYHQKSYKELSQKTGISESTLRVKAQRARAKLKGLFKTCCQAKSLSDLKSCDCD
jgi:RNA polymerase sigma-70 factor (ECF subfamily)